jgi:phage I-like protein
VSWTDRAKELLRAGEYRYFSPVIYWTDEDYTDVAALGPVALTNDPAMRGVRPLAASRREPDERLSEEVARDEASADAVLEAEIAALNQQIELLQKQLATQEADAFVERGMRLGKIVDSTGDDWREDYLRDPERAQTRLQRAPVLLPPGRVLKVGPRGEVLTGSKAADRPKPGGDMPPHGTVEPEDLAAYDQALAAGRIRRFAASPDA